MAKAKTHHFARRGQSKPHHVKGKKGLFYTKAGKTHKVSPSKDRKIKAKHTRSRGSPAWRGDIKGSRI